MFGFSDSCVHHSWEAALKQKYVFLVNLTKQWYALEEITHAESNFNLFI